MIPFNKPYISGDELKNIEIAHKNGNLSGDGYFTKQCSEWLETRLRTKKALLTHSCTAALEMAAILINIQPGDEIIMPSFTFVSSANAFVLRGGIPVFVDIKSDTLNIDENLIETAITANTKAILVVHYAGYPCAMEKILKIAHKNNLFLIEDAAQGLMSKYNEHFLGTIGDLGCLSFHETKNIISGEGGALLINNSDLIERAEIIREKGTNRSNFFRGQVDKYTWVDIGSSLLPSEIIAAFLHAQLMNADFITNERKKLWDKYHSEILYEGKPQINTSIVHNSHIYYLKLNNLNERDEFILRMKEFGISTVFHYIPLHSSPGGIKFAKTGSKMNNTNEVSDCLVRLPLWIGMDINYIIESINKILI
jgi:dTDP-4-amino-4,6-dideoxygalactose transaminase